MNDRGWNDPPMFHCQLGSDSTPAPPKTKFQLNKRVAYPSLVAPKPDSSSSSSTSSSLPSKSSQLNEIASSPPRLHPFLKGAPPKAPFSGDVPITSPIPSSTIPSETPLASYSSPSSNSSAGLSSLSSREKRDKVVQSLRHLTEKLKEKKALPEKQAVDILKKIDCLENQWAVEGEVAEGGIDDDPPLEDGVKEKLGMMAEEVEAQRWELALKIQVALAVDHAGAAKKWVMALKKLFSTAKSAFPETVKESEPEQQPSVGNLFFQPSLN